MISRLHITAILFLEVVLWFGILLVKGTPFGSEQLAPFSTVVGMTVIALAVFDKWIWKWDKLRGWFVKKPNISGSWLIQLHYEYNDEKLVKDAFLVVRQRFSHLSIKMLSDESSSQLTSSSIGVAEDGTYWIYAVYRNEPNMEVRERSEIHYGGLRLVVAGDPPSGLSGVYWTDRRSRGDIRTVAYWPKKEFATFEAADSERQRQAAPSDAASEGG